MKRCIVSEVNREQYTEMNPPIKFERSQNINKSRRKKTMDNQRNK